MDKDLCNDLRLNLQISIHIAEKKSCRSLLLDVVVAISPSDPNCADKPNSSYDICNDRTESIAFVSNLTRMLPIRDGTARIAFISSVPGEKMGLAE